MRLFPSSVRSSVVIALQVGRLTKPHEWWGVVLGSSASDTAVQPSWREPLFMPLRDPAAGLAVELGRIGSPPYRVSHHAVCRLWQELTVGSADMPRKRGAVVSSARDRFSGIALVALHLPKGACRARA